MVVKVLLFGIRLWTNTVLLFQESLVENDFKVLFSVCIAKPSRTIFKVLFVENDFKVVVGSLCQHLCACVRSFKFWPRLGRPPSSLCCELVSSIISWQDAAGHDSASEEQCVFCRRWFQVWRSWWSGQADRRSAGGGRPTDADAGVTPATQVATARRNRASGGGLCVIARGTKEQKPPFSFFSESVPGGLLKSMWCFFVWFLVGQQTQRD